MPRELPQLDTDPRRRYRGQTVWVDPEEWEATADEISEGNRQGREIDPDDDEDNGLDDGESE